MIKFVELENYQYWDSIVASFPNADIYYSRGYTLPFQHNGDGEPILIYFESPNNRSICVMMKRDISDDSKNFSMLEKKKWWDMVTPYGYGGFIFEKAPNDKDIDSLKSELQIKLRELGIISVFFRFHPVLNNAHLHDTFVNVIELGKTITIDLKSPETIWGNLTSKNRNTIKNAEKSNIVIKHGKGLELLQTFKTIYDQTMKKDHAESYYFFDEKFYEVLDFYMKNNYEIFYAEHYGNIIAMSIILCSGNQIHYHLSGSIFEFRNFNPTNLLLYKVALWGYENGYKTFHLGGGVGSGEDNLYKFKASFNRNSNYQFSIGKLIIDNKKYQELVSLRKSDSNFDSKSSYFPLYRS